jgi:hypothetical protein
MTVLHTYGQKDTFKPIYSAIISPGKGKKLLDQCSRLTPTGIQRFEKLNKQEIGLLEKNFKKIYSLKGLDYQNSENQISSLNDYGYQFLGVRIRNKKYIYINAFSIDMKTKNWRTEPYNACDGGIMFWGALFSLKDLSFSHLNFNLNV